MNEDIKIVTYLESLPDNYVSAISLTMAFRESERWKAELLLQIVKTIEGWDIKPAHKIE